MTPEQLQGWLQAGLGVLMLAALVLGYKGIWYFGPTFRAVEKERDDWKAIAQAAMGQNTDLIQAASKHTTLTPEQADMALKLIRESRRDGRGT